MRGEFKDENEQDEKTFHIRENCIGAFERQALLPIDVETEKGKLIPKMGS